MDNTNIWPYRPEAIIVPLSLLFVPVADVVRVILFRIHHHKPLFDADKNHIHHKLMRTGLNQHQALACILTLAVWYIVMNSLLYMMLPVTIIVIIDIALFCFVNICINKKMKVEE
jgi:UDP-N-acetylmuramyl pentapeptide phosphotransferase/UDP-N-acetylglucosamine-1-phosphate transferase